ncbi:hypothetical protein EMIHUDRAFT_243680 [Emiliania huxleyi CCMP1516]|uniref:Uncharacterized protein n=2 Tax=Emiliania huxleyi TaxID=2903 RepID=A0A0D3J542_EMIH1|nr:hypothetical protein EMIHUDRAFT_243680 [Emiliania huxleyi CCMP1516]EOD18627.1 hypothetical protein EMIHUDRAFT_243680 [Emiliania huxleyi CCMP1516]|eukprot:XP_005771056.1 hypothetical protein EMIHUDRAFT_243680 [Emiliania huxleyi CCMP1516]
MGCGSSNDAQGTFGEKKKAEDEMWGSIFDAADAASSGDGELDCTEAKAKLGLTGADFDWLDVPNAVGDLKVSRIEFITGMKKTYDSRFYSPQELADISEEMMAKAQS